jgi:P-type Cu+ transporter
VHDYREIPASGTIGLLNGITIKMGSADFINCSLANDEPTASHVYISYDGQFLGYFTIKNRYREGTQRVITELKKKYELHLISGDNDAERENLIQLFGPESKLSFNQSPNDKLEYIKKLKAEGKRVAMVGDGLNDAGALSESDLAISIADDAFNFSPACDAILEADNFQFLPQLIQSSSAAINVVYASFGISFLYNIIGLFYAVSGNLSPIIAAILMPASSVTVVGFVTLATNYKLRHLRKLKSK